MRTPQNSKVSPLVMLFGLGLVGAAYRIRRRS